MIYGNDTERNVFEGRFLEIESEARSRTEKLGKSRNRNKRKETSSQRFLRQISFGDGCWEWQGSLITGYGKFHIERIIILAHRVSWWISNGRAPDELQVCHKCDNRRCVNPDHLFLGTQRENMQDMSIKGRSGIPKRSLTDAQIQQIKSIPKGKIMCKNIAERYGVHHSTISRIQNGVCWKSIKPRAFIEQALEEVKP